MIIKRTDTKLQYHLICLFKMKIESLFGTDVVEAEVQFSLEPKPSLYLHKIVYNNINGNGAVAYYANWSLITYGR